MMKFMDVHARIHTFMQQKTTTPLVGETLIFPDQQYMKAGVVPFIRQPSHILYLMMKPIAKSSMLPPPTFQICKGTRMFLHRGSGWRDMKAGDEVVENKEHLMVTAFREGIEEVGLVPEAIVSVQDVGPYKFLSERTGKNKYMWLYTTELASPDDLLPMSDIASTTAQREWLTAEQFEAEGRLDHRAIVQDIDGKLQKEFGY